MWRQFPFPARQGHRGRDKSRHDLQYSSRRGIPPSIFFHHHRRSKGSKIYGRSPRNRDGTTIHKQQEWTRNRRRRLGNSRVRDSGVEQFSIRFLKTILERTFSLFWRTIIFWKNFQLILEKWLLFYSKRRCFEDGKFLLLGTTREILWWFLKNWVYTVAADWTSAREDKLRNIAK